MVLMRGIPLADTGHRHVDHRPLPGVRHDRLELVDTAVCHQRQKAVALSYHE
jgi:hypothetical protein